MGYFNFKNSILLLVYYNAVYLDNLDFILNLYSSYFKKIIIYSTSIKETDIRNEENYSGVNFLNTAEQINITDILLDFYQKYNITLQCADGLFYTTYDTLININILENFRNDKIIYFYQSMENLNQLNNYPPNDKERNFFELTGTLIKNKKTLIDNNLGCSNFFYLPEKYFNEKLFSIINLLSNYKIPNEISIPFLINILEKKQINYQKFNNLILPGEYRNEFYSHTYIRKAYLEQNNLFLKPFDIHNNLDFKDYILKIKNCKKCVVITTINKPTDAIMNHIGNPNYEVIIVGDLKTPDVYKDLNCIYLDIENQNILFPELSELIPLNHYSRKNLGYLYAIHKGFEIIYETDDDNIPIDNFEKALEIYDKLKNTENPLTIKYITERDDIWINVFSYYTAGKHIWPRGLPLSKVNKKSNFSLKKTQIVPSIICGMVKGEPDVDAIYRLTHDNKNDIKWRDESLIVNNKNMCIFNTQNTFWVNPEIFFSLYIPSTVSFRYTDILRGIIANYILKLTDNHLMFSGINVEQIRNEHDLSKDYESEHEMYIHNENIISILEQVKWPTIKCIYLIQASDKLPEIYDCFREKGNYILLSYKQKVEDTHIFFPNSTWTSGRNKLREYILENNSEDYDYFIFLDEDILFQNGDNKKGFQKFEEYLNLYRPEIGAPRMHNYEHYNYLKNKISSSLYYDGICNAFHKSIINSKIIFPWDEKFDSQNWWMSQNIMCCLNFIFDFDIAIFTELHLDNIQHSNYVKGDCWEQSLKYCFRKCLEIDPETDTNLFKYIEQICYNHNPFIEEFEQYFSKFKKIEISTKYYYDYLKMIYQKLVEKNIVKSSELDILEKWLEYFY